MLLLHCLMVCTRCFKQHQKLNISGCILLGSEEALGVLLQANAHDAFLYAISHFTHADPPTLRAAFSRALRALAASIADVVGPSMWGLRPDKSLIRSEAQQALAYLFQVCIISTKVSFI